MSRGPLPESGVRTVRRRNAPTIPTTKLPAEGYAGPIPKSPYTLGPRGKAWWRWAWRTPSAAAWGLGDTYYVARRAALEDDLAALELPTLDLGEYLDIEDSQALKRLTDAIKRLKGLAGGRTGVLKLMGELDKRLGLDPKALAELRWTIKPPVDVDTESPTAKVVTSDRWAKLKVADTA
jgi:hypothetical protein